jgi:hypothetical protein
LAFWKLAGMGGLQMSPILIRRLKWCVGTEAAPPLYAVDLKLMSKPVLAIREQFQLTIFEGADIKFEVSEDMFPNIAV